MRFPSGMKMSDDIDVIQSFLVVFDAPTERSFSFRAWHFYNNFTKAKEK